VIRAAPVALLALAAPAWGQSRFADPVIAACDTAEVRLRTLSAADMLAVCEQMQRRLQPPLRASHLRDLATAVSNLAGDGWTAAPAEIARQVIEVIALRGQQDQPRLWRGTAELLVRIHADSDAHVTPAHLSAALATAGPAAQLLDDEGLRRMAVSIRERQRRGG
jgi:hypothetical protein